MSNRRTSVQSKKAVHLLRFSDLYIYTMRKLSYLQGLLATNQLTDTRPSKAKGLSTRNKRIMLLLSFAAREKLLGTGIFDMPICS